MGGDLASISEESRSVADSETTAGEDEFDKKVPLLDFPALSILMCLRTMKNPGEDNHFDQQISDECFEGSSTNPLFSRSR